jgi:predicted nucleic acid-binding protein
MGDRRLAALLEDGVIWRHEFILGELVCGNLKNRSEVLALLAALPPVPTAQRDEVMLLLDREELHGKGLGWIDAHLLASALLGDCVLWTLDARLKRAATKLGIGYSTKD